MKVRLVIDSTADVASSVLNRFTVVPLTVHFGDEEYIDGVTIDHKTFYEKLVESDVLPSTSQASPAEFLKVFEQAVRAGEDVVVITVSSKLSGTYQSAMIAAEEYKGRVFVVDGKTVSIGSGILAELALRLADSGMSAAQIAERLTNERENLRVIAMLDTLEYLKKGGRISGAAAFAGGILSIKPVVCIDNGEIKQLGKARGSKQGNNLLMKEIEACGGIDFEKPILLGFTGLSDLILKKYIEDSVSLWHGYDEKLRSTPIGSVVGTHAGPGAIAAAFFKK
ncbi:MAG: DegV family protein [Clostridia bacterium]|nr:DegV family protein [Clostridia bacterium]